MKPRDSVHQIHKKQALRQGIMVETSAYTQTMYQELEWYPEKVDLKKAVTQTDRAERMRGSDNDMGPLIQHVQEYRARNLNKSNMDTSINTA